MSVSFFKVPHSEFWAMNERVLKSNLFSFKPFFAKASMLLIYRSPGASHRKSKPIDRIRWTNWGEKDVDALQTSVEDEAQTKSNRRPEWMIITLFNSLVRDFFSSAELLILRNHQRNMKEQVFVCVDVLRRSVDQKIMRIDINLHDDESLCYDLIAPHRSL